MDLRGNEVHRGKSEVLVVTWEDVGVKLSKLLLDLGPHLAARADVRANLRMSL